MREDENARPDVAGPGAPPLPPGVPAPLAWGVGTDWPGLLVLRFGAAEADCAPYDVPTHELHLDLAGVGASASEVVARVVGERFAPADAPGRALLIPAGQGVAWRGRVGGALTICLAPDVMDRVALDDFGRDPRRVGPRLGWQAAPAVAALARLLLARLGARDITPLGGECLARELAARLLEGSGVTRPRGAAPRLTARQVRAVEDSLAASPPGEVRLGALAATCGLGERQFLRAFRASTGVTPMRYALERRVARAADLLRHGREPVAAVAAATGFHDQAHLTRAFRALRGVTPGAHRAASRGALLGAARPVRTGGSTRGAGTRESGAAP